MADWCNGVPAGSPGRQKKALVAKDLEKMEPVELELIFANPVPRLMEPLSPRGITAPEGDRVELLLPTGAAVAVSAAEGLDWFQQFPTQERSSRMWLWSLWLVGALSAGGASSSQNVTLSDTIVRSFVHTATTTDLSHQMKNISSSDHSASVRITSLISHLQSRRERSRLGEPIDWIEIASVVDLIQEFAEWLCDPKQFSLNNHGLLSSMALLHASMQFRGSAQGTTYGEIARERVRTLMAIGFDSDGLANENTPGYHNFNLGLYREIRRFVDDAALDPELSALVGECVERGEEVLAYCLRQDSTVPPIGDSPVYRVALASVDRSRSFRESGLTIIKDENLYLSFVCGARSEAHKQHDDTSITLRYKGQDVIIDGGSYNYDLADPYRRYFASSKGHSGLFARTLDGMLRHDLVRYGGGRLDETVRFFESERYVAVEGFTSTKDRKIRARRQVVVVWPDEVVVLDSGLDGAAATESPGWVSRFLFGPSVQVQEMAGGVVRFVAGSVSGAIFADGARATQLYHGEEGDQPRGWCSVKNFEKLPTTGLDLQADGNVARFAALIKLSDVASLNECSELALEFASGLTDPFGLDA